MNDRKTNEIHRILSISHEHNESQHSAIKYLEKCFSSLQNSFMQYDYESRFI